MESDTESAEPDASELVRSRSSATSHASAEFTGFPPHRARSTFIAAGIRNFGNSRAHNPERNWLERFEMEGSRGSAVPPRGSLIAPQSTFIAASRAPRAIGGISTALSPGDAQSRIIPRRGRCFQTVADSPENSSGPILATRSKVA